MKKTLVFAALLTASLTAHAETLSVHLPYDFATTGTLLPAGDYSITPVAGSTGLLLVRGSGLHAFVFGRVVAGSQLSPKATVELSKDKSFAMSPSGNAFSLSPPVK